MSGKLVIGQIGCGAIGMDQHGPNALSNPHVRKIKWACDVYPESARAFAGKFGAERTAGSFAEVTSDPEVDIVCVATTHEARVPIIEDAARHGKHIFCEKPLAMTEKECYQIIKAVRAGNVKLCVNYMRRAAPAVAALKREWLKHKENPRRQPWQYRENPREKFLEETVTDFLVRVQDESASYRTVHMDPFRGGGLIIGEAGHWIDLACWLYAPDRPVEVRAWGSTRMRYGIHIAFQSGNAATITFTPNGTFDYPKEMYEIAHDGALFRMEFFVENQYLGRPGPDREVFPLARDSQPESGKQGGLSGYQEKRAACRKNLDNLKTAWGDLLADHGYQAIFNGFIEAVLNDKPTPCDELAGYRATCLANLAMRSAELNQPLPVPMEKWDYFVQP